MSKTNTSRFSVKPSGIWIFILLIFSLLGSLGVFSHRWDLTDEKRYTLSPATIKILKQVKEPMTVKVFLEGNFPAKFRYLRNETEFLLEEFKKVNEHIEYQFIDPIATKMTRDTLEAMGMSPSILPEMRDGKMTQIVLFPYAAVQYKGYGTSIPLIIQQRGITADEQINQSVEGLEYNFISTIKAMVEEKKKNIGFLVNQDELRPQEFGGFIQMALQNYNIGPIIPENNHELSMADWPKLEAMQALVIAKPRKAFTDKEKLILDQYIMQGGKTLWLIDRVNAEMDTLYRSKKIMAYPIDLNLTDFFFNYGLRITSGLVKDMKKSAMLRVAAGQIAGNTQYNSLLWPYFPLGIATENNPITKNINPVKFEFPTAIDTLHREGVKKTVLFESSDRTLVKPVPNYVSLSEIANADSLAMHEHPSPPRIFAVLLEGKFKSAYQDRIESKNFENFKAKSPENKMIVISDGDVARNSVLKGKALPLGYDLLTNAQYGNAQFLQNALDYLLDDDNLMSLRNRNLKMRLLDRQRISFEHDYWQWLNLLLPLAIIALLAVGGYYLRRKRFR